MGIIEQVRQMKIEEAEEEGRKRGQKEQRLFFVKNLLSKTSLSPDKIASLVGVNVSFVNKVKASLKK
jgi:predicted transposase YdaD